MLSSCVPSFKYPRSCTDNQCIVSCRCGVPGGRAAGALCRAPREAPDEWVCAWPCVRVRAARAGRRRPAPRPAAAHSAPSNAARPTPHTLTHIPRGGRPARRCGAVLYLTRSRRFYALLRRLGRPEAAPADGGGRWRSRLSGAASCLSVVTVLHRGVIKTVVRD